MTVTGVGGSSSFRCQVSAQPLAAEAASLIDKELSDLKDLNQ